MLCFICDAAAQVEEVDEVWDPELLFSKLKAALSAEGPGSEGTVEAH
jgi:hypothetical protein